MITPRDNAPKGQSFRAELVARVRCEIAEGTYETPEKLEMALARLFDCLGDIPPKNDTPPPTPRKRTGKKQ